MEKTILKPIPGIMATGLLMKNVKLMKKPTSKKIVKMGVKNLIGIPMISKVSKLI